MAHQKSLKYVNKLKQIDLDFSSSSPDEDALLRDAQALGMPVDSKDEIDDIFTYKQGRHKLKRKKRAKRTKFIK